MSRSLVCPPAVVGLALCLPALATGQNTVIVDVAGGGRYTQIQPAIDAASPGDTVLVRPGTYIGGFLVDKGIRVIGGPGVLLEANTRTGTGFIGIQGIGSGQSATVRDFGSTLYGNQLSVIANSGHVHVERIGSSGLTPCTIRNCGNVVIRDCSFYITGLRIESSNVVLSGTRIQNGGGGSFLSSSGQLLIRGGSRVWFSEGICRAGGGGPFIPPPAVTVDDSTLFIAGDATTVFQAGTSTSGAPMSAIQTVGAATVIVDSHVTLTPVGGAPVHTGTGTFGIGRIPSMRVVHPSPNHLGTRLFAPGGLRGFTLLSLPAPVGVRLPPLGDFFGTFPNVILDGGAIPSSGERSAVTVLPAGLPVGLPVVVQGLVAYADGNQLSAPAPTTLGQ